MWQAATASAGLGRLRPRTTAAVTPSHGTLCSTALCQSPSWHMARAIGSKAGTCHEISRDFVLAGSRRVGPRRSTAPFFRWRDVSTFRLVGHAEWSSSPGKCKDNDETPCSRRPLWLTGEAVVPPRPLPSGMTAGARHVSGYGNGCACEFLEKYQPRLRHDMVKGTTSGLDWYRRRALLLETAAAVLGELKRVSRCGTDSEVDHMRCGT